MDRDTEDIQVENINSIKKKKEEDTIRKNKEKESIHNIRSIEEEVDIEEGITAMKKEISKEEDSREEEAEEDTINKNID